jgi:hypothetical protein
MRLRRIGFLGVLTLSLGISTQAGTVTGTFEGVADIEVQQFVLGQQTSVTDYSVDNKPLEMDKQVGVGHYQRFSCFAAFRASCCRHAWCLAKMFSKCAFEYFSFNTLISLSNCFAVAISPSLPDVWS